MENLKFNKSLNQLTIFILGIDSNMNDGQQASSETLLMCVCPLHLREQIKLRSSGSIV